MVGETNGGQAWTAAPLRSSWHACMCGGAAAEGWVEGRQRAGEGCQGRQERQRREQSTCRRRSRRARALHASTQRRRQNRGSVSAAAAAATWSPPPPPPQQQQHGHRRRRPAAVMRLLCAALPPPTLDITNSSMLTSSASVMRPVWIWKMRRLVFWSGSGNSILRSMRPADARGGGGRVAASTWVEDMPGGGRRGPAGQHPCTVPLPTPALCLCPPLHCASAHPCTVPLPTLNEHNHRATQRPKTLRRKPACAHLGG